MYTHEMNLESQKNKNGASGPDPQYSYRRKSALIHTDPISMLILFRSKTKATFTAPNPANQQQVHAVLEMWPS